MATVDSDNVVCGGNHAMIVAVLVCFTLTLFLRFCFTVITHTIFLTKTI
jgi:hypothetical protein